MPSWMTPIARTLNELEDKLTWIKRITPKWVKNPRQVRIVLMAGTALFGVIGILLGASWVYYDNVVRPRQEKELAENRMNTQRWKEQQAAFAVTNARTAAEWKACQKHHPEMKSGTYCPEPLETYEKEVSAP